MISKYDVHTAIGLKVDVLRNTQVIIHIATPRKKLFVFPDRDRRVIDCNQTGRIPIATQSVELPSENRIFGSNILAALKMAR